MSYAVSAALQAAIYEVLSQNTALADIVGNAIFDAVPTGPLPGIYVTIGAESVRDASDKTGRGAVHDLGFSVITDSAGFQRAKQAAAAISDALNDAPLQLRRGRLVSMTFTRAVAKRENSGLMRRIDLTFRARIEDD